MPIGLIAAGVGAAGAIGGAVISSNSSKSAANTAASASRDAQSQQAQQFAASQQALQTGAANANVVQGQQHDATLGTLGGLYGASADTINQGYASSQAANKPYLTSGTSALNRLAQIYGLDSTDANGNSVPGTPGGNLDPNATFYQSPDYQFALSQGVRGTDAGAAARGMLDSGATRKAEITYAGNLASGQFNNYAQRLASLAGVGQTAAGNAAAGATNYVNAITGNNNNYGNNVANANNAYATQYGNAQLGLGTNLANTSTSYGNNYASSVQNAANNQANATLQQGANTSNALNGLAGSTAQYLNSNYAGQNLFSSSYSAPLGQSSGASFGWT